MARGAIDPVLADHPQVELEIWPYELNPRPNTETVLTEEYKAILTNKVRPKAEKYGLELSIPARTKPHTDIAFFGLLQAEKEGKAWEYTKEVCRVFWAEGKNIADREVLAEAATAVGLNTEDFKRALEDKIIQEEHRNRLQQAYDYDKIPLNYVPHLEWGEKRLEGIFDEKQLRDFLKENA